MSPMSATILIRRDLWNGLAAIRNPAYRPVRSGWRASPLRSSIPESLINLPSQFRTVSHAKINHRRFEILMSEPRLNRPDGNSSLNPPSSAGFAKTVKIEVLADGMILAGNLYPFLFISSDRQRPLTLATI
jgi:hypothetical protein